VGHEFLSCEQMRRLDHLLEWREFMMNLLKKNWGRHSSGRIKSVRECCQNEEALKACLGPAERESAYFDSTCMVRSETDTRPFRLQ
jgi:hypothetical protein